MACCGPGVGARATWRQGLTLVHFSAQRKHFSWDALGTSVYVWVMTRHKLHTKRLTEQMA
jgi:hypothetical protein